MKSRRHKCGTVLIKMAKVHKNHSARSKLANGLCMYKNAAVSHCEKRNYYRNMLMCRTLAPSWLHTRPHPEEEWGWIWPRCEVITHHQIAQHYVNDAA